MRKVFRSFISGLLGLLFTTSVALAEEKGKVKEEKEAELEEIVVTATRTERPVEEVPASVTVITKDEIEKMSAKYVDDLLRDIVSAQVYRPAGVTSTMQHVTLRGVPHQRGTLILLDGVPLNDMYYGGVEFNEIPVENVERIEIVRGPASALYGSSAMGGVINIITKKPEREMKGLIEGTYGTMNTWSGRLHLTGTLKEKFGYYLSASRLETDGYYAQIKPEPNWKKRTREHEHYIGKFTYEVDPMSNISFTYSHWHEAAGGGRKYYYGSTFRNRAILGYEKKTEGFNLSANTFFLHEDDYWTYDKSPKYDCVEKKNEKPSNEIGAMMTLTLPVGKGHLFTSGLDYRWFEGESRYDWEVFPFRKTRTEGKQHRAALFFQDEIDLGKLLITLGCRGDWYRSYDGSYHDYDTTEVYKKEEYAAKSSGSINPKLGLVYHLTSSTTLRGLVGRAFNAPYVYYLYHNWGFPGRYWYMGNPELDPEYMMGYEAGVEQRIGEKFKIRFTGFHNDIDNYIGTVYVRTNPVTKEKEYKYQNIDEVESRGLELEAEYRPLKSLTLYANYNYIHAKIEESKKPELKGKRVAREPYNRVNFGFIYDSPKIVTFSVRVRYVGERYDDLENKYPLDGYTTCDIKLTRKIGKFVEASIEIDDLFDEAWQESKLYNAPGRIITGRLKVSF
ncbi:MAG: TonB-dependent receptor [Thermodesulfovibrionales bacterium]|nr:TonB-dependent receptor [Thermodesulfovibrionales bacterium]